MPGPETAGRDGTPVPARWTRAASRVPPFPPAPNPGSSKHRTYKRRWVLAGLSPRSAGGKGGVTAGEEGDAYHITYGMLLLFLVPCRGPMEGLGWPWLRGAGRWEGREGV